MYVVVCMAMHTMGLHPEDKQLRFSQMSAPNFAQVR